MARLTGLVVVIGMWLSGAAGPAAQAQEPADLLVAYTERNPSAMVIGSDSPAFALYADGHAIYWQDEGYVHTTFNAREMETLRAEFAVSAETAGLEDDYDVVAMTSQTTQSFYLNDGTREKVFHVYGDMTWPDVRAAVPARATALYDLVAKLRTHPGEAWEPQYYEVMIWRWDTSPDDHMAWSETWPSFDHPMTRERHEESFSLYFTPDQFAELNAQVERHGASAAIDGRTWAMSYRVPFPHEIAELTPAE